MEMRVQESWEWGKLTWELKIMMNVASVEENDQDFSSNMRIMRAVRFFRMVVSTSQEHLMSWTQAWCLAPTQKNTSECANWWPRTNGLGHRVVRTLIYHWTYWNSCRLLLHRYVERTRSNSDTLCVSSAKAHISRVAHQFLASKMMLPIIVGKSKQEQSHWCNSAPKKVLVSSGQKYIHIWY